MRNQSLLLKFHILPGSGVEDKNLYGCIYFFKKLEKACYGSGAIYIVIAVDKNFFLLLHG